MLALAGANRFLVSIPVILALVLILYSQRLRKETARDLGWRTDNFWSAIRLLIWPTILGMILLALVGKLWFGTTFDFRRARAGWLLLGFSIWGFAWGLLQQFVLQSFINRRAQLIWGKGVRSILLVASIFALLHLPNPLLTIATFLGGLIWATVYQRAPNLYALAISHAFMTWVLISTLPGGALQSLRVGYKYFG